MLIDLKLEKSQNFLRSIKFYYDYIIIGTGPAGSVILENLKKKNVKKILVIERGNFNEVKYENLNTNISLINKNSRAFTVGGSSLDWAQIYSFLEPKEMQNNKNKSVWPLSHKKLNKYCKLVDKKFGFELDKLNHNLVEKNLNVRKFQSKIPPVNFQKFYKKIDFDLLINCKIDTIDEKGNYVAANFSHNNTDYSIKSKKLIICAGGIETTALILRSLKKNHLKKMKNKDLVGKFFMDHPKGYMGYIRFPNLEKIKKYQFVTNKKESRYYGFSLKKKKKNFLNSYVRIEEVNDYIFFRKKFLVKIFLEMEPKINNKIYLDKSNKVRIKINLSNRDKYTVKKLLKEFVSTFSIKERKEKIEFNEKNLVGASHHMGGMIFPKIVDKNLKINGLKKVYCCTSAIFPTSGSVNPTLIICALGKRLSDHLLKRKKI